MKIILCHNFYRKSAPSGEDVVYCNERALLQANGIDVISYERFNDDIDESTFLKRLALGYTSAWSAFSYKEMVSLIRSTQPDIAHFHNTFPLISPSVYAACKDNGVPVVQTVHNYRFICPGGLLLRDHRPCEDCVGRSFVPALRHRCYRRSLPATAAVVWMLEWNRFKGTFANLVDRYITLTRFQADRLIAGGLPPEKIRIKPNFLPGNISFPKTDRKRYAVYVGHLGEHKGVRTLLLAWRNLPDIPLQVVGSGPLMDELKEFVAKYQLNVKFLGFLPRAQVLEVVSKAMVQVVPSECYEGFPLVIVEAYACGTPVIASRIGSLAELVENERTGLLFEPGDAKDLADSVTRLIKEKGFLTWGKTAYERFVTRYNAEKNMQTLSAIYSEVAYKLG